MSAHIVGRREGRVGPAVDVADRDVVVARVEAEALEQIEVADAQRNAEVRLPAEPNAVVDLAAAQGGPQTEANDVGLEPHAVVTLEAEREDLRGQSAIDVEKGV